MKQLPFAIALLVAGSGAASADISLTGSTFVGIGSVDGGATWTARSSISLSLSFSSQTDSGLAFGVDLYPVPAAPALPALENTDLWLGDEFASFTLNPEN